MGKEHFYSLHLQWTGNTGAGTENYRSYTRDYTVSISHKPEIHGSSDPAFRGDASRHNPEELFVASLSACHMLWYLHLCADAGIVVEKYEDRATGTMQEDEARGGFFKEVILHPVVVISNIASKEKAFALHELANKKCFIANSCNFPVRHQVTILSPGT